jgi:hypothetical protein
MTTPVPIAAIKCQLAAIIAVALDHDEGRLPIRAAFRDGPQLLEPPDARRVLSLPRERHSIGGRP